MQSFLGLDPAGCHPSERTRFWSASRRPPYKYHSTDHRWCHHSASCAQSRFRSSVYYPVHNHHRPPLVPLRGMDVLGLGTATGQSLPILTHLPRICFEPAAPKGVYKSAAGTEEGALARSDNSAPQPPNRPPVEPCRHCAPWT